VSVFFPKCSKMLAMECLRERERERGREQVDSLKERGIEKETVIEKKVDRGEERKRKQRGAKRRVL